MKDEDAHVSHGEIERHLLVIFGCVHADAVQFDFTCDVKEIEISVGWQLTSEEAIVRVMREDPRRQSIDSQMVLVEIHNAHFVLDALMRKVLSTAEIARIVAVRFEIVADFG